MLLPPHYYDLVLWLRFPQLSVANLSFCPGDDLLLAIQRDHSHAESSHLQPEEQGGEGSCEKNAEKMFLAFQIIDKKKSK